MIYLGDITHTLLENIYKRPGLDFSTALNNKIFRAADTKLSYRQIQELEKVGLQKSERSSKKDWRKYTLQDIVCFLIIGKLKDYGFNFSQLKIVVSFLYETDIELALVDKHMPLIEALTISAFGGIPIYLLCTDTDVLGIFDSPSYDAFTKNPQSEARESYLVINVTSIFGDELKTLDKRFSVNDSSDIYSAANQLSDAEKLVIKAIRNGSYNSVEVVMKNGKVRHLNLKKAVPNKQGGLTEKEIIALVANRQFGSITVHVEGGKIVNLIGIEKLKA
jgi:hypothetical protein